MLDLLLRTVIIPLLLPRSALCHNLSLGEQDRLLGSCYLLRQGVDDGRHAPRIARVNRVEVRGQFVSTPARARACICFVFACFVEPAV
jgi:hypothetical protein